MLKKILTIITIVLFSVRIQAQVTEGETTLRKKSSLETEGWKNGGVLSLNFAQTSLTNWAAGGQNSMAVNGLFSLFANYKKGKTDRKSVV